MKLNDLLEKYGEIEVPESVIEMLEEKNKNKRWRAETGERYFVIHHTSNIFWSVEENDDNYDPHRFEMGNYFKTKEEAEFAREKIIFIQKMKDEFAKGGKIDWESKKTKYTIDCDAYRKNISYIGLQCHQPAGCICCNDLQIVENFIKENEDDILKYIFEVEE